MRDILTVVAGLLVLVLVAALAVPPLVDWGSQRGLIEHAIARTTGLAVTTDGELHLRLLPSPRVTIEHLTVAPASPEAVAVDARGLTAEIALESLLQGEILFRDSRAERMEVKLPAGADGDWRVPKDLLAPEGPGRRLVLDDFAVGQLLLTSVAPATGRTDQIDAQSVRIGAQSLAGPWRVSGTIARVPFDLATGAIGAGRTTDVKLATRGRGQPNLELDAKLQLTPQPDGNFIPNLTGSAKASGSIPASAPDGAAPPWTATAKVRAAGNVAELDTLTIESAAGGLRLEGTGRFDLAGPILSLDLAGRRLDLPSLTGLRLSDIAAALPNAALPGLRAALSLRLDLVTIAGEELTGLSARGILSGGRVHADAVEFTAPGPTQVTASGDVAPGPVPDLAGRVAISARSGIALGAFLDKLGVANLPAELLGTRSLDASAEIVVASPVTSLRNLRAQTGDAVLSGNVRYAEADGTARPRLDAQLSAQGVDLSDLTPPQALLNATRSLDLGLTIDARNVAFRGSAKSGRITARINAKGSAFEIARLDISDLAGANAALSGRLEPDGTGQIAGRVTAREAAPLLSTLGPYWIGGLASLVPGAATQAPIDLSVTAERVGVSGEGRPVLRTHLAGTAGGGSLDAEVQSRQGRVESLSATLAVERSGTWLPGLDRPSRLLLSAKRGERDQLAVTLTGEAAGLKITTRRPFTLSDGDAALEAGSAELSSADAGPLFSAFGVAAPGVVPAEVSLQLKRMADGPTARLEGRISGTGFEADVTGRSLIELSGSVALQRLSLPWLAAATVLRSASSATGPWSTGRFGAPFAPPLAGTVHVRAANLDLGRGFVGQDATFDLTLGSGNLRIDRLDSAIGRGRLTGDAALNRSGGLASIIGNVTAVDLSLPGLLGTPFAGGTVSGTLRFGGSGESAAAIVANLGGAGSVAIGDLRVSEADPGAVERVSRRALGGDDPLAAPKLAALAGEELSRGPLDAASAGGLSTLIGGVLRVSPVRAEGRDATWQGSAALDLRTATLDIRGSLVAKSAPPRWSGPPPSVLLGWAGPIGRAARNVDVAPLVNGLAATVLTRELDRIETFELDAAERARLNNRTEMDRARRADEAARQARLRDEAERARAGAATDVTPPPPPPGLRAPVAGAPASGG